MVKIGDRIRIKSGNDNENYDKYRNESWEVNRIDTNKEGHRGFDDSIGGKLISCEGLPFSLYEYEFDVVSSPKKKGKGWHGDRPGHVAASVRKSIEGTLKNPMVKSPIILPNKSLDYKPEDFNVIRGKDTGDPRIPFAFESKDGKISANFFWYNEGVFLRSMVGDTGILEIRYPLVHSSNSGYNLPPFQKVLHGLIVALKRGNYQGEFTDNTVEFRGERQ